jgi:hypothetical protein
MWRLDMCREIYSRAGNSPAGLQQAQSFRFIVKPNESPLAPSAPAWLWRHQILWQNNSHLPKDFDWLVDYLDNVYSNNYETAGDILVLLSSMRVNCSPAIQRLYIEKLITCMGSSMPPRLRHAALRAAHSFREVLASADVVDDADMVLTKFSLAILTAVCPQLGTTPTDDGPDCFFHPDRDLCYLELIFALAGNSVWHPHFSRDGHIDRCTSIIAKSCDFKMHNNYKIYRGHQPHAFYLVGIFLRTTPEELSVTSLSSITEHQWWDMMRKAWYLAVLVFGNTHFVELLPVLVERTKKYMCSASGSDLEQLIDDVDDLMRLAKQGRPEQREGVAVAAKELRGKASDMLAKISQ